MNTLQSLADHVRKFHVERGAAVSDVGVKAVASKMETSKENGGMLVWATANTADIDLDDEVVVPEGAETRPAKGGGVEMTYLSDFKAVYLNHRYFDIQPIGTHRKAVLTQDGWRVQFYLHGKTQESADVINLLSLGEDNPVRGTSVGFERLNAGRPTPDEIAKYGLAEYITRRWKCLEYSVTPRPCNPGCSILAAEAAKGAPLDDDTARRIDKLRASGVITKNTAAMLGVELKSPRMIVVPKFVPVGTCNLGRNMV